MPVLTISQARLHLWCCPGIQEGLPLQGRLDTDFLLLCSYSLSEGSYRYLLIPSTIRYFLFLAGLRRGWKSEFSEPSFT